MLYGYMKIVFNPLIKNRTYLNKQTKIKILQVHQQENLKDLGRVVNYSLSFNSKKPRAVYAINYDGSYEKFDSIKAIKEELNISYVRDILEGKGIASGDKVFVYADEIEQENGKINQRALDRAILAFKDANSQPIYSINYQGEIQRFNTPTEASIALGVNRAEISENISESRKRYAKYVFARAFDVELRDKSGRLLKDENGNQVVDIDKINKLREKFLYKRQKFPVIRVEENGDIKIYRDMDEAAFDLKCKKQNINQALLNQKTTQGKYTFARLSDVVLIDEFGDVVYDENNDFVIDYDKVEVLKQSVFEKY